ncbi:BgTH12-07949 [Blumeria graminis f. sp. triticale]|uniref:Golgi apparatus membrane protein TVP38 n=1 Tax=Blumeria graminis f. sp. triticale TaxID=1689686 RepID=A0A9W4D437_BLUGR|nr:BgTH12-07949 [Blumeria graminis f. sp. triticale]
MMEDYSSTAKALSLPISPRSPPLGERQAPRPSWSRHSSRLSRRGQNASPNSFGRAQSRKARILKSALKIQRKIILVFTGLPVYQQFIAALAFIFIAVSIIIFLIYNERIFGFLTPYAEKWRDTRGGWLILWVLTFIAAFPPVFGYSTTITMAGFIFGFPNGWFIVATATVCGSLVAFVASRTILSDYVHRMLRQDKRFEALASTLKHDGLKVLCMIRFCPLPYSISNAAMSTFPTVHPASFALATAIASPKLLIHVFIGSRMAAIADSGQGRHLDAGTKVINYISILTSLALGTAVSWIIYKRTIARARELEFTELQGGMFDSSLNLLSDTDQIYRDSVEEDQVSSQLHSDLASHRSTSGQTEGDNSDYIDFDVPSDRAVLMGNTPA